MGIRSFRRRNECQKPHLSRGGTGGAPANSKSKIGPQDSTVRHITKARGQGTIKRYTDVLLSLRNGPISNRSAPSRAKMPISQLHRTWVRGLRLIRRQPL